MYSMVYRMGPCGLGNVQHNVQNEEWNRAANVLEYNRCRTMAKAGLSWHIQDS